MKRLLSILLVAGLFLGVTAVAFSDSIPQVTDPKNVPIVWTQSVYNGSGSDIATGVIVQWDFDTSDPDGTFYDDQTNYVKLADAAGDIWTAGVVPFDKGIANGEQGVIIVRGPCPVKEAAGTTVVVNTIVETDANGLVTNHDGDAVDESTLGICIKVDPAPFTNMSIIWVNPIAYDKD
ncbi:hypothetical protein KKF61_08000 [Patescibacteria group bacterium]|nr:hypothetical protein [Patescibacteria group bacterium]